MKSAIHIKISAAWSRVAAGVGRYRARLLFCLRVTTAAVMAFAVAGLFALPFHGLWAVLTAVVVIQMSLGASLRAKKTRFPSNATPRFGCRKVSRFSPFSGSSLAR